MKKRSLLIKCLLASLIVHVSALLFFYRNPLLLTPLGTLFKKTRSPLEHVPDETLDLAMDEKNRELEEAFAKLALPSPQEEIPFDALLPTDMAREASLENSAPVMGIVTPEVEIGKEEEGYSLALPTPSFVPSEQLAIDENLFPFPQIAIDKAFAFAPLSSSLAPQEADLNEEIPTLSIAPSASFEKRDDEANVIQRTPVAALPLEQEKPAASFELKEIPLPKRKIATLPAAPPSAAKGFEHPGALEDLNAYLFPEIAEAEEWEEGFDVKVSIMQGEDKKYIFSVSLTPNQEMGITKIPQNFYFLIDRSNSIEKHRFSVYKRAVLKALSCLQEGDKFNIILFDKRVVRMSEKNVHVTRGALQRAEEFLDKQEHGGMFASCDLFGTLEKILPGAEQEKEVHTAILLTDGKSIENTSRQQKKISGWMQKNSGRLSLYTAAVGHDNNLLLLDLLSSTSGGDLLYSDTHAAFPRRLGKLMLNLQGPLLKDIMISATPKDASAQIVCSSCSSHLPLFYQHMPYEIVGTIDKPSDFTLLIQGRHKEEWVAIKKEISLKKATKANRILEKKWLYKQAQAQYGNFVKEGKSAHLTKAKELLKSAGNEIASQ